MMETEAKEKRKRRVKREEGPSRANRIAERGGGEEGREGREGATVGYL